VDHGFTVKSNEKLEAALSTAGDGRIPAVACDCYRIPFQQICGTRSSRKEVFSALVAFGAAEMFTLLTLRAVVEWKWKKYGLRAVVLDTIVYLVALLLAVVLCSAISREDDSVQHSDRAIGSAWCLLLLQLSSFFGELWQLRMGWRRYYFSNLWNYIDWARIASGILACSEVLIGGVSPLRGTVAVMVLLHWLGLLAFLQAYAPTGPLIRMVLPCAVQIWLGTSPLHAGILP
jgi:hypothetical protein